VVWVQEEPDGVIVGLEFTSLSGTQKSVPPPPMGAATTIEGAAPAAGPTGSGSGISED
jgi:hypothetical protein